MNIYDYYWWVKCRIKKVFLKVIYNRKLIFAGKITHRNRFLIYITSTGQVKIGDGCFFNNDCSINCNNKITIGDNCIFGENVKMYDHNHKFNKMGTIIKNQGLSLGEIKIGNNVWVGSGVVLLKGCCIGDNCVISAGVIVGGDVPSNTILRRNGTIDPIIYDER